MMKKHFNEREFSLTRPAYAIQVSPVYLRGIMKQGLGITFVQLSTEMRLDKGVHLIETTPLSILDVAEHTGY
ncbi:DNA-binding response regulator, partial [Bacillus paralicheniformis]|nr:DNA-binding response regulator [Bacillus paralicheniformis]